MALIVHVSTGPLYAICNLDLLSLDLCGPELHRIASELEKD